MISNESMVIILDIKESVSYYTSINYLFKKYADKASYEDDKTVLNFKTDSDDNKVMIKDKMGWTELLSIIKYKKRLASWTKITDEFKNTVYVDDLCLIPLYDMKIRIGFHGRVEHHCEALVSGHGKRIRSYGCCGDTTEHFSSYEMEEIDYFKWNPCDVITKSGHVLVSNIDLFASLNPPTEEWL